MSREASRFLVLSLCLCIGGAAGAHHPPLMERCQSYTFTGQIERIEWSNPHVEVFVRTDSGDVNRVIWLNPQQLGLAGITRDTLHAGESVIVTVGTREDVVDRPMLLSALTRTSDEWEWSQVPQGC